MRSANHYIFGIHPLVEALRSGKELEKVYLKKGLTGEAFPGILRELKDKHIPFQFVPVEKLNRMCAKNHQGVVAQVSEIEYHELEKLVPFLFEQGQLPLLLMLDRITDVRNMGAIARTAECAGFHALVIPTSESAQINADAVKTSSGALHRIPVCRMENLAKTITYLKECGFQVISATEKAERYLYQADFTQPSVIIMGSEETGIDRKLLQLSDQLVKIPLRGEIASLNVSAAASVMMYEAVRQRLNSSAG